jgi:predicted lipoprotein
MKKHIIRVSLALFQIGAVLLCVSCDDDKDDSQSSTSFDRTALLSHYDQQIIHPSLQAFDAATKSLQTSVNTVSQNPSNENLEAARTAWVTAIEAYSNCYSFNFGPGESLFGSFAENVGTFPASEQKITTFITNGDTSQSNFERDSRGIYGLEYLLFQSNALTQFSDANYAAYARSVARHLTDKSSEMTTGWESYRTGFTKDNGTGSSSSITVMYNEWLKGYELIKNFMVGVPAGLRAGQTSPEPEQVAGYYSKQSKELIRLHLLHIEAMYFGAVLPEGDESIGFDDFLLTTVGGDAVLAQTKEQWNAVWAAYNALPDGSLDELVVSNPAEVEAFYTELSKHTRFFKSELSSRIGLTITYDSGDGD